MYRPVVPFLLVLGLLQLSPGLFGQTGAPKVAPLMTDFAKAVVPTAPLPEYPRPQLVRTDWVNLNGRWDYAISGASDLKPSYSGQIIVPFPVQSALSGVMLPFDPSKRLWYHRTVTVPPAWNGQRILLHFGAVSWQATVFINGAQVGVHCGDYDAFTVDVTDAAKNGSFDLAVQVADPIDTAGGQPRGKQASTSRGIAYTASTGIWRTVWMEPVGQAYIDHLVLKPDVDNSALLVTVAGGNTDPFDRVEVIASSQGKEAGRVEGQVGSEMTLPIPNPHLWDFSDPFLYDLKVTLYHGVGASDEVTSYFGMRKVSLAKDAAGILRPMINNKFVFQIGVLDQGYWPAGLYTAPTDEALKFDILMTKKYGFNVSRKHMKVEPDRWYYWCDKLGLMVWQDMPAANLGRGDDRLSDQQAAQFQKELNAMVDGLMNHPCIVQWDLFNEGWGQHDTHRLTGWLQDYDPTRLVDSASGFYDMSCGQVIDKHQYPGPGAPNPEDKRIAVLGEFGGITTAYPGHLWGDPKETFGYNPIGDPALLTTGYPALLRSVWPLLAKPGLSAAIYTQLTDVEQEANGLMTYDRVPKMDPFVIRGANRVPAGTPGEFMQGEAPEVAAAPATK